MLVALLASFFASGCETSPPAGGSAAAQSDPLAGIFGKAPEKSGAQIWGENCTRCHNVRPPTFYAGYQWPLVIAHMRSRADLTGDEERKVVAFLQAGAGAND